MKTRAITTEGAEFLAYKGYGPRGLEALQRALANTWANQPKKDENATPISSNLKYVYRDNSGKKLLVYVKLPCGKMKYVGRSANDYDAKAMQDDYMRGLQVDDKDKMVSNPK